jgi:hypothetical protein
LVWQNKSLRERCISFLCSKMSISSHEGGFNNLIFRLYYCFYSPVSVAKFRTSIIFVFVKWKHHMNSAIFWLLAHVTSHEIYYNNLSLYASIN